MKRRFEVPSNAFDSDSHAQAKGGAGKCRRSEACVSTSPLTQGILPHNLRFPSEGGMAVALWNQWPSMLRDLAAVGRLLVITRNAHAVLGRYMEYPVLVRDEATGKLCDEWGTFELDPSVWHHACAKEERHPKGYCYSIEVFDSHRQGIHKVCLTPEANLDEFLELVRVHQATGLESTPGEAPEAIQPEAAPSSRMVSGRGHSPLSRTAADAMAPTLERAGSKDAGGVDREMLTGLTAAQMDALDAFEAIEALKGREAAEALEDQDLAADAEAQDAYGAAQESASPSSGHAPAFPVSPLNPELMRSFLGELLHATIPVHMVVGNEGATQSHTFVIQEIRDMGEWTFCSAEDEGMHLRFSDLGELSAVITRGAAHGGQPVWRIRACCADGREMFVMSPGAGASLSEWNRLVQERMA
ncbi:hypothetical protein DB346_12410 [Verrucomicrobia bacterium LW23]|nr:hypothetical protein DB346_12410 [Verrucomicrobia bacterium LW23]